MIRTIFVWFCIVLGAVIFGLSAVITYPFDRKGTAAHHCGRIWAKVALLANRVRVRLEGLENVRGAGPYIFMSNHQGSYDIFALLGYLPFQFKWLAKKELFSIPILGWAMSAAGYISIDRARDPGDGRGDEGGCPENPRWNVGGHFSGRFTYSGRLHPAFSERRVYPGHSVAGSHRSHFHQRKSRDHVKGPADCEFGEIRVRIGPPIETHDYSVKSRTSLMEKVRETILENFLYGERG